MALVALLQQHSKTYEPRALMMRLLRTLALQQSGSFNEGLDNCLLAFITLLFHSPSKPSISAIHVKGQLSSLILP